MLGSRSKLTGGHVVCTALVNVYANNLSERSGSGVCTNLYEEVRGKTSSKQLYTSTCVQFIRYIVHNTPRNIFIHTPAHYLFNDNNKNNRLGNKLHILMPRMLMVLRKHGLASQCSGHYRKTKKIFPIHKW